jgi:LmbE family N-acetylglucosaminyl deacetylase
VEQTCGGTLLKMAERGYRTGILDLTRGEMGTRGSAEDREREAAEAARILKTTWRGALDIPDGRVENTWENKLKVARMLREQRPAWSFFLTGKAATPITTQRQRWATKRASCRA